MNAGALNVLHDSGDKHAFSVGNAVDLKLLTGHVFVDEHRVCDVARKNDVHIGLYLVGRARNAHALTAYNVRRAQQYGITEDFRRDERLFRRVNRNRLRARHSYRFEERVELFAVFRKVYALCRRAEDFYSVFFKVLSEFYRRLTAECDHDAEGFFGVYDVFDVFFCYRLEIEAVAYIVVRRYGFGVVVYDYNFITEFFKHFHALYRAVVEFYALAYADRSRAENENPVFVNALLVFARILSVVVRIIVRRGAESAQTRIYRLEFCIKLVGKLFSAYFGKRLVGVAELFALQVSFFREDGSVFEGIFKIGEIFEFFYEKRVDFRDFVQFFHRIARLYSFENGENAHVVYLFYALFKRFSAF